MAVIGLSVLGQAISRFTQSSDSERVELQSICGIHHPGVVCHVVCTLARDADNDGQFFCCRGHQGANMAMGDIWLFLVRSVFVFQAYFGLLCLGYLVAAFSFGGSRALVTRAAISIEINCVMEVLWYLVWFLPYRARRQRPGYRPTALRKGQRVELFRKVLEHVPDPEQFVRRWAKNAHMEDIRRENLKEWLLWVLFDQEGPPGAANVELEDYVTEMEEKLEARIKPGRGDAEMMRPSLDVVVMNHRSLLYYQVSPLWPVKDEI